MTHVEKLLVFFASPGDVQKERQYAQSVVAEVNTTIAASMDLVLQVVTWENDTFPGYGMDAQSIINAQIAQMSRYALFVGVMWNRLGTPTPRAPSGTVEEFALAAEAFRRTGSPEIWFYFRDAPVRLDSTEEVEQRRRLLEFREQVRSNGMPWSYRTPSEFRSTFQKQLTLWLNERRRNRPAPSEAQGAADAGPAGGPAATSAVPAWAAAEPESGPDGPWVGPVVANRRRLTARISRESRKWFRVRIEIDSTDPSNPLDRPVHLHLHPTFPDSDPWLEPFGGVAVWEDFAYGAFPVWADIDDGAVSLSLDLGAVEGIPKQFRAG
mgnify:CR=1 FL=1